MGNYFIGKFVILRTYSAGVHAGIPKEISGDQVLLEPGSRRLWYWNSGKPNGALHSVAKFGLTKASKVETAPAAVQLNGVIEIIEVAPEAIKKFGEVWG